MRISDWSSDVCSSDLAYVLADAPDHNPQVLLLASGSEVSLCVAAYEQLLEQGVHARVVSMPSWELFEAQSQEYRDQVQIGRGSCRGSVCKYVSNSGVAVSVKTTNSNHTK